MTNLLLIGLIILVVVIAALQVRLLLKKVMADPEMIGPALQAVDKSYERAERIVREEIAKNREEGTTSARAAREELAGTLQTAAETLNQQIINLTHTNDQKLERVRETIEDRLQSIQNENTKKLSEIRLESVSSAQKAREEATFAVKVLGESQQKELAKFSDQLGKLIESNQQSLERMRAVVEEKLKAIQQDNARQLDQMRATVDEKLQGTLEKRLGESFKLVSDRLEQVYKGLGEMQALATGVGDLKKVLTNVKTRGTWGEVQLGTMLEQILTPDQYEANVATKPGGERVEFAVRLPGRGQDRDEIVWLPIDAKFPVEDYQRLVEAQESADAETAEVAARQLDARIKKCARDVCDKYINPPKTTDFAILFLPTEGLFAEVIRRTGLPEFVQRECRVVVAGPTTLWSILNSLQMGFRTLAIEKRSSEVWKVLGAVKTEFGKFGDMLEGVKKQLDQASNTIEDATRKSRTIQRKLRSVQELPVATQTLLMIDGEASQEPEEVR